jgi:multidrug efflux system outer membrane protein
MLGNIFTDPANAIYPAGQSWQLGAAASQTLLDFGRIASDIRVSDARAEEALTNLKQRALTAFSEVETALATYVNSGQRLADLTETETKAQKAFDLSRSLYLDGLGEFLNVLDAQRELLMAQQTRQAAEAAVVQSIVDLESAMGGTTFPEKPQPAKDKLPLMMLSVPQKLDPSR